MESKILYEGVISFMDYECNPSYTVIISYDRKLVEKTLKDISDELMSLPKVKRVHLLSRFIDIPEIVTSYLESLNQFEYPIVTSIIDHEIDRPLVTIDKIKEISPDLGRYGNMSFKELKEYIK